MEKARAHRQHQANEKRRVADMLSKQYEAQMHEKDKKDTLVKMTDLDLHHNVDKVSISSLGSTTKSQRNRTIQNNLRKHVSNIETDMAGILGGPSPNQHDKSPNNYRIRSGISVSSQSKEGRLNKSVNVNHNRYVRQGTGTERSTAPLEDMTNSNVYDRLKVNRMSTINKIPATIVREISKNRNNIFNQNNPNNMFKDFYDREENKKRQLNEYSKYMKDDIQNRRNNREQIKSQNYNFDKNYIDNKVNEYRRDIEREFNRKKTSKMQMCNENNELKRIKGEIHAQRHEMTDAERKININNLNNYHGENNERYHGSIPGWDNNHTPKVDPNHSKKFSDIHRVNRVNNNMEEGFIK